MATTNSTEHPESPRGIAHFFVAGRRLSVFMALVFLPWLIAVLAISGAWVALNLIGYALVVCAAGYAILRLTVPAVARADALVFAPALGILAVSSLTALWLRFGLPLVWVSVIWLLLVIAGVPSLWSDRSLLSGKSISYSVALAAFSFLICAIFFFPSARRDAVLRPDGSFNWIYVDTQYSQSIAADIESGDRPPRSPGDAEVEFRYHFAAYTPAAVITRITGLQLGDALVRVTRGASLWALLLACFGLGTILSRKATGGDFGGIMSVAGLFFYGSMASIFTDSLNSSGYHVGPLLFKIPEVDVLADGGPFAHLILGHSTLHGMIAITGIVALCLLQEATALGFSWQELILVALPALTVPMNSVAALYCLGAAGILLFWNRLGRVHSWLLIALMLALFLGAWRIMGFTHGPSYAGSPIDKHPYLLWWTIVVEFTLGFGFRILGFRWCSQPFKNPFAMLVITGTLGLLVFYLALELEGNERYGIYFAQALFSIFAFSRVPPGFWRGAEREKIMADWLRVARTILILLAVCGLAIGLLAHFTHHPTHIEHFHLKVAICILVLLIVIGAWALMKRSQGFSAIGSALLMATLSIGFFAWITPWLEYGMDREPGDITISPGEVRGLERLRQVAAPGDLFATNKHLVDSLVYNTARSYSYGTLSLHPVLLEGYAYQGIEYQPGFKSLLQNNDLMFTTADPNVLHELAETYHVRWLVARPGTDISLPRPLPPWLQEEQGSGDLKIYKVD
jgi:hypothetical protein